MLYFFMVANKATCQGYTQMHTRRLFKTFLTHDIEDTIALNNDMGKSSGFTSDTSLKIVKRESVEQLSTTPLN